MLSTATLIENMIIQTFVPSERKNVLPLTSYKAKVYQLKVKYVILLQLSTVYLDVATVTEIFKKTEVSETTRCFHVAVW